MHLIPYPLLHVSDYGLTLSDGLLQSLGVMLERFDPWARELPVPDRPDFHEKGQVPTCLPAT